MSILRLFFFACLAVLLPAAAPAQTAKITFIVTNDIYLMGETLMADGQRRGGFARLAAVVKAERAKGGHVVFAHGGDTLSPSLMSGIDQGAHIIALTNMIRPDIFVPGNHEFDFGKAVFFQRMAEAKFPLYAANLRDAAGQALPGFKDRAIVDFGGVRVGLTGAAYDQTPRTSSSEGLKFLPTIPIVKEQAALLRREGADFVVAVMHGDRSETLRLAAEQAGELILSGHNHDLFVNFDGRAAIAESSYDAHYVVLIDVTIEVTMVEGKRQARWWPQFRITDSATVTPDPEVAAAVEKFEATLNREMDVPLATTGVELDSRNIAVRTGESAIGNLIADAMRNKTGANAAIMNGGGIRGGKRYPPGSTITRRDVLAELPFGNRIVAIDVRGRDLRSALENGFSRLADAAGRFPQVSGMKIEFDPRRPPGKRIVSIRIGNTLLNSNKVYRIATNDFLARGGDGYEAFGKAKPLFLADDAPLLASEVIAYLQKVGTVRSNVEGRINAVQK